MFILKNLDIEAKQVNINCESSEANVVIATNQFSEANLFILKLNNIEAKWTGSIVILYLKRRKKRIFVLKKIKGKKQKCLIMNYQSFAIPTPDWQVVCNLLLLVSLLIL